MKTFSKFLLIQIVFSFHSLALANVAGTHLQTFNPTMDGLGFVTVHSTQTLSPGVFNFSFFTNSAWDSLPFYKLALVPDQLNYSEPDNRLWSADIGLAFGVTENWQIGVGIPMVLDQSMDASTTLGSFDDDGVTEIKLHTKYRFWQNDFFSAAGVASANFDRINNNPYSGADPGATLNLDTVGEYKMDALQTVAVNIGYRIRDQGQTIADTGVTPLSDQLTYSVAYSYLQQPWNMSFIFEIFGASAVKKTALPVDRQLTSLEALAGAKYNIDQFAIHGGFTTKLIDGLANPDFRIYLGVGYTFGPLWAEAAPVAIAPPPPPPTVTVEEQPSETIVLSAINFAFNSKNMHKASRVDFERTAVQMGKKAGTIRKLVIEGHTDSKGSDDYNKKLGQGRANTVREIILSQLPLKPDQVTAVGIGEDKPIATNDTEAGRAKNRRVEIKIYRDL
ncbi:MAG: OmpA family protein [Bdellovibrionales bacterium]|nr:OmpA family protein [Bdellovibrionales bacterium]